MFWPKNGCFRDGRSPRTYSYVFGDYSCYANIGECLKYILLLPKPGQNGLRRPLNIVLSPDKAKEWHKEPQIGGFPKIFKPFGLDPPYLRSRNNGSGPLKVPEPVSETRIWNFKNF